MRAVRGWITLMAGTLLLSLVVGCSAKPAPSESAPSPPKTTAAPTPPASTTPAPPQSPAPQAPLMPPPKKIVPPPSEAPSPSSPTSMKPEQANPLRPQPGPSKIAGTDQKRAKFVAPERSRAMIEETMPSPMPPSHEKSSIDEPSEEMAADMAVEEAAPEDGQTLYFRDESMEEKGAAERSDYTVVKVYYATDRAPLDVSEWRFSQRGGWPTLTGICAIATATLMFWRPRHGSIVVRSFAWFMLMTTVVIGGLTIAYQWQPEPTDRAIERMYGNDRGELELGACEVSVPKEHEIGELESPTVLRLEFREDPERHVVLLGVYPESPSRFFADLHACIDRSARKEAFVFVHGYNVGFVNAVRRTAQIAYDLKFEGAPIVYSWPSQEGLLSYTVDETNVEWTVPHLKEFLVDVAERSGATSIHLVAHSMGNRALTSALRELVMERKKDCPRFHEVILTAPDIDAEIFRRDIAPAIVQSADRVTLYASSNDEALMASRTVHGSRRAGESGDNLVIVPGVDTVDVSEVDTSLIGHSYYGSNSTVLADLFELMQSSKPAEQRRWLQSMRQGALKYWKFFREKLHPSPSAGEEL